MWRDHIWFCQAVSSPPTDFTNLLSRFLKVTNDNRAELFIFMAWGLWNRRNTLRIGLPSLSLDIIGPQAAKLLQDFINAQEDQSICNPTTSPNSWCPLSSLSFKANFDGAIFSNSHSVGVGVVIRNESGKVVAAMTERTPLPNLVVEVEAMACRRAVKFAYEVGIQEVIFEGDSLTVIPALNNGAASEAPYGNLIDDIIILASHLSKVEFCHVKRSCNRVADALAKRAKTRYVIQAWIEDLPIDIAPLANFDVH